MVKTDFYQEIRHNNNRTILLFIVFFILIIAMGIGLGWYLGNYYVGTVLLVFFGIIYALIAYFAGSSIVLSLSKAKPATKKEHAQFINAVEGLAIAAGLPAPKPYVVKDTALNAFATGRNPKNSAIAVTTGLLSKLNREELEGVIAHEMAHVRNYDIRTMLIASVLVGVVTLISDFLLRMTIFGGGRDQDGKANIVLIVIALVLAILAPIIAQLIKLAISRKREFAADAEGARLCRNPKALASALKQIKGDPDPLVDSANKATAHMFISTPFRKKGGISNLFATHPSIDERISLLENM